MHQNCKLNDIFQGFRNKARTFTLINVNEDMHTHAKKFKQILLEALAFQGTKTYEGLNKYIKYGKRLAK